MSSTMGPLPLGVRQDLPLQRLAERCEEAIDPLYYQQLRQRVLTKYPQMSSAQFASLWLELKRYLLMSCFVQHCGMYSDSVDDIWHEMLLYTRQYRQFCQQFCGRMIHHEPATENGEEVSSRAWFDWLYLQLFEPTAQSWEIWGGFLIYPFDPHCLSQLAMNSCDQLQDALFRKGVVLTSDIQALCVELIARVKEYCLRSDRFDSVVIDRLKKEKSEMYVAERARFRGEQGRFRFLHIDNDNWIQGGIEVQSPDRAIFSYIRAMVDIVEQSTDQMREVYLIGHGVGSLTREMIPRSTRLVVAEIDEDVLQWSKRYFGYRGDHVQIGDGRAMLRVQACASFDVILLDAFIDGYQIPVHLRTRQFFVLTKERLRRNGRLVVNMIGDLEQDQQVEDLIATIRSVYSHVKIFAKYKQADFKQNLLVIASSQPFADIDVHDRQEVNVAQGDVLDELQTGK